MNDDQLDLVFGALADRTRRAILAQLAEADTNVGDLTALFTMSHLPVVARSIRSTSFNWRYRLTSRRFACASPRTSHRWRVT